MFAKALISASLLCLFCLGPAIADVEYRYVTDQKSYTVPKDGSAVTVKIFLEERVTGDSKPLIGPGGSQSVSSVALGVIRESGAAKIKDSSSNTSFGFVSSADITGKGKDGGILVAAIQKWPKANKFAPGISRLQVGTFTIVAAGKTTYKLVPGGEAPKNTSAALNGDGTMAVPSLGKLDNDGVIDGQAYKGTRNFPFEFTVSVGK